MIMGESDGRDYPGFNSTWRSVLLGLVGGLVFVGWGDDGIGRAQAAPHRLLFPAAVEWSLPVPQDKTLIGVPRREYSIPRDLALIDRLPEPQRQRLRERIAVVHSNQRWLHEAAIRFWPVETLSSQVDSSSFTQKSREEAGRPKGRLVPDYHHRLDEVVISIPFVDSAVARPLERYWPLLQALPPYSKVHVLLAPEAEKAVLQGANEAGWLTRMVLHPVRAWSRPKDKPSLWSRDTRWVRDFFMVGVGDHSGTGGSQSRSFFLPPAYAVLNDLSQSDTQLFSKRWQSHLGNHKDRGGGEKSGRQEESLGDRLFSLPAFVRGGNVFTGKNLHGQRIALLGEFEIQLNQAHFQQTVGVVPPPDLVPEVIKHLAQTTEIRVLPNSMKLFHLDMVMTLLGPGVAGVISPLDEVSLPVDDRQLLNQLRQQLLEAGFSIIPVPTTRARMDHNQSPVNAVLYTDKRDGKRYALVPRFPDTRVRVAGRDISLNEAIANAYRQAGVEPVWVEDRFHDRGGNLHCALVALR